MQEKTPQAVINSARRKFSKKEDEMLLYLVESGKCPTWAKLAEQMPGRTARQCRDRYLNYLSKPNNKNWSPEEIEVFDNIYKILGENWKFYQLYLPKKSIEQIKNQYFRMFLNNNVPNQPIQFHLYTKEKITKTAITSEYRHLTVPGNTPCKKDEPSIQNNLGANGQQDNTHIDNNFGAIYLENTAKTLANLNNDRKQQQLTSIEEYLDSIINSPYNKQTEAQKFINNLDFNILQPFPLNHNH